MPLFRSCIPLVFHYVSGQLLVKNDRWFESSRPDQFFNFLRRFIRSRICQLKGPRDLNAISYRNRLKYVDIIS